MKPFPVRVENTMQDGKPLFPVQSPRRCSNHLEMVERVYLDTVKPRPRRLDIVRFNRKGQKLCLDKPIIAPFKLRLQHLGVFGSDTVKAVPLRRDINALLKIFLVGIAADKGNLDADRCVKVVIHIA